MKFVYKMFGMVKYDSFYLQISQLKVTSLLHELRMKMIFEVIVKTILEVILKITLKIRKIGFATLCFSCKYRMWPSVTSIRK